MGEGRRLNILQIISGKEWSGGQQQTLYLLQGLRERGHDVMLACPPESILGVRAKAEGIKVFEAPMRREADFYSMYALYMLMKKEHFDVVNVQRPTVHTLGLVAAIFAKIPAFVVTRRVLFPIKSIISAKIKYRFHVSRIIAVSDGIKKMLVDSGINGNNIMTIHDGIDIARHDRKEFDGNRIRQEFGIPTDAPVAGMITSYEEFKGHDYFIKAIPFVLKEVPDAFFIMAGRGTDSDHLKKLAASLGVIERTRFAGFRTDVLDVLAALDISVNCALMEGLSVAILESFAMGIPVVATEVGGIPEIVKDGLNGILVPSKDEEALASGIIKLLKDKELRENMGNSGRALVRSSFSADAMVDKTEAVYLELFGQSKRSSKGIRNE